MEPDVAKLRVSKSTTVHSDCDMSVWSASDEPDVNVPVAYEDTQMLPVGCRIATL